MISLEVLDQLLIKSCFPNFPTVGNIYCLHGASRFDAKRVLTSWRDSPRTHNNMKYTIL